MEDPSSQANPPDADASSFWSVVRRLPRTAWLIYCGSFVNRFGTFVLPFLALHMTREGYSAGQVSLAMGAYGVGHLCATMIGGYLADRLGRRSTIVLSMFSGAVAMLALSQADSMPTFVVLAWLTGMTTEFYRPASSALLSDLVGEADRVTAFALYRFAINAGWALGPATAGFLSEHSYLWLFVGDAISTSLYGLIVLVGIPPDRGHPSASDHPGRDLIEGFRCAFGDPRFVRVLVASLMIGWVFMQMMTTFGLEMKAHGHAERVYGLILGLNGVIIVLCEVPLSAWTRRWNPLNALACGHFVLGLGVGLIAVVETRLGYAVAMSIFTLGEMIAMPVGLAYVSGLAPVSMRGRYMGIYGLTWASAITLGPSLGMMLFHWNPTAFWFGSGVIGLVAGGLVWTPLRFWRWSGRSSAGFVEHSCSS